MVDQKKSKEQIIAEMLNFQTTSSVLDHVSDFVWIKDLEGRYVAVSESFANSLGISSDNMIGKTAYDIHPAKKATACSQNDRVALEKRETVVFQETDRLPNGETKFFETKKSPVYDLNGDIVGIVGVSRDITERKRTEEHLRYLGYHDMLTGLYNRNYFESFGDLSDSVQQQEKKIIGLITCDIDGLKLVNDTLGHDAGDKRLKYAAKLLTKAIGQYGFWARIGGDEFAAVIPDATTELLEVLVHAIREMLLLPYNQDGGMIPLNIAIGHALGDLAQVSFNTIFKEADNAMYRDKMYHSQSARNTIVKTVTQMLKARDFITEGHAERLQHLVVELGKMLDFPEYRLNDLKLLAQFHDIGKIGIPDSILFKPGSLNAEERAQMCRHSEIGFNIAQSIPEFASIAEWILKHHERWDGTGYPLGLRGEQIPLECRILVIADSYDAMISDRPYRKALSRDWAVAELKKYAGSQFDPSLVHHFLEFLRLYDDGGCSSEAAI